MKYEIRVTDLSAAELAAVSAALAVLGAEAADVTTARIAGEIAATAAPQPPAAPAAPTPPAPPAAPAAPTPPAAQQQQQAAGDLDKRGVPWNANYHASTKGLTKQGAWIRKKGTDQNVVEAWEAGFIGKKSDAATVTPSTPPAATGPANPPAPPAAPTPPAAPASNGMPPAPSVNAAPPAPPSPPAPPAPPAAPAAPAAPAQPAQPAPIEVDYNTFYGTYMELLNSGKLNADNLAQIHTAAGLPMVQSATGPVHDTNAYMFNEEARAIANGYFRAIQTA